jgi:sensor domain CHASE-containing protein
MLGCSLCSPNTYGSAPMVTNISMFTRMDPFAEIQPRLKPLPVARFSGRLVLILSALCLVVGLGLVAWRAKTRLDIARAVARTEARASGAALELQLSQAATAAEVLGALAKQGRSGFTNFQKVAQELLAAHPGLASLDLEPGGVVSDIVPRAGYERAIGFNVLKDVGQRAAANEAIARRVLTVTCPVTLYHGEPGIVARIPVFQRALNGRESFWGFVGVSMVLQEALARAHFDQLRRQGYTFALFAPTLTPAKTMIIASHGFLASQDVVQQPVRVQNLELRIALRPQGGWIDTTKVVIESLAVLLFLALLALLVNLVESRRGVEGRLVEVTQRLTREQAGQSQALTDRTKIEERMAATQAEFKNTQLALEQAHSKVAQIQGLLDASTHEREEAVRVSQAEQKEAHAALVTAQETIAQLQVRLTAATQAEHKATSVAEEQLQQHQLAMAELRVQLEASTRLGRDTAETNAATLAQLEQSKRESEEHLLAVERAEVRIKELDELLQKAQEELRHRQVVSSKNPSAPSLESDLKASCPVAEARPRARPSNDSAKDSRSAPGLSAVAEVSAKPATEKPTPVSNRNGGLSSADPNAVASLLAELEQGLSELLVGLEPVVQAKERSTPARRLPATPPVDLPQLRKAVNQIVPLLTDQDPGAKDCLKDNRLTFRSAFTPEGYVEFEQLVKTSIFDTALEQLKKAVRKQGIAL